MQIFARTAARRLLTACAVAVLSATTLAPPPARAADPIVMKIGTATLNDQQHEWMKRFAAALERDSKGRIKVEIYPDSQLGSIQAWVGPPEFLSGVDPRFEVLSAPNLFRDEAHANRALQDREFSTAFLALGADKGLKGLALFVHGPAQFDTRRPVKTLDDLKGLKIRVLAAQLQMEQIARLGGTPVPMPLDQVLPALQQGAIDGAMTDVPVFSSLKFYDVAKYIIETNQSMLTSIVMVSKQWYDALPADLRALVSADGEKTAREMLPWVVQFNADQRKVWTQNGGEIVTLTPAERRTLTERMASIPADVLKDKPDIKKMYDLVAAAATRTAGR